MSTVRKVVIIHGFFMKAPIMWPLQRRLEEQGFTCLSISYATYQRTLAENVRRALPKIQAFAAGEPVHFIGHSLGGFFIRHLRSIWPEGFVDSRVITLGTPHQGCSIADYLVRRGWEKPVLNRAYHEGLDGAPPPWSIEIPLLSIAGSNGLGLGIVRVIFGAQVADVINDGVVGYGETLLPEARASLLVYETHMTMLFSKSLIKPIVNWLNARELPASNDGSA
ncbi:hypothetical protein KRX19_09640 [Cardiobacteriaceae bacterium TAE3-ERU3]|nr:hypothetical protein [Cardiobacteriaceae bacterium TAE3-ERU3]